MKTAFIRYLQRRIIRFVRDRRGIAATEFAIVLPMMLVGFFGTVEFCSAVAVSRKVTLMARTLSDLTSQNITISNSQLTNIYNASTGIMTPYSSSPLQMTITQIYIDPNSKISVMWSNGANARASGSAAPVPAGLVIPDTYLIFSEVKYQYVPTIGYVMAKTGVSLSDVSYTRPRQSTCVTYTTGCS